MKTQQYTALVFLVRELFRVIHHFVSSTRNFLQRILPYELFYSLSASAHNRLDLGSRAFSDLISKPRLDQYIMYVLFLRVFRVEKVRRGRLNVRADSLP